MAVGEPESKRLTEEEILAMLERPEYIEVTNTERIATYLEEVDEAFIEDSSTDPLSQPEQQLPCELNLGPKSTESDDSGRGSGDMPISDLRSRYHPVEMEDKGVTGLVNIGNSCYMNAGLQCLLSTPALVEYFGTRHYETLGKSKSPRGKLLKAFGEVFNKVWGPDKPADGTLKLNYFKFCLSECHGVFKGSSQQDCQEFVTLLLDTLDEQLKANIFRGRRDLAEARNDLPGSSASKGTDLAGPLSTSSSAVKSPLKLSSIPNRRAFPKVTNAIKSVSLLPEFSIFTTVPKFVDSKKSDTGDDENDISSDCQVVEADGSSKFPAKKPKSAQDFPPAKRVRLDSKNEPSRSGRTADYFSVEELKISDDEEDSQRVPALGGNPKPIVSELNGKLKQMSELDANLQRISELSSKSRLEKAPTISAQVPLRPDNGQRVQKAETDTCSVITKAFEGALTRTITCAVCNHSSSESEPFQNLTLPIPRDTQRLIRILFESIYDINRTRWGRYYDLSLRLSQTVKDIKETIISLFPGQLKRVEDMVMTYMWDHEVQEVLPDDFPVRNLNETKSLYMFEVNHDFLSGSIDIPNGYNDLPNGPSVNSNGHSFNPNGHNNLQNRPRSSLPAEHDVSVDSDASTFVLDEDVTILAIESPTMNNESLDCSKCWKTTSRDNVRVNVECECVLCLECIEELTQRSTGTYKCPQCTQKVGLSSLCPIDNVLMLFKIAFMNEACGQRCLFGYPMLVRLPSKVPAQQLRKYLHQTGIGLGLRSDEYDILLLSHSSQGCVTCGPDSYCPGCPILRSGLVLIPEGTTIVIRFLNLLTQDIECMRPKDMAIGSEVHFDPDYIFEAPFHINDCLDLFTGKETLEHEQFCVKCDKNQKVIKSLAISHCPDYVILNVERHGFGIDTKLENPIEFNLKLDLSKYVSPECAQSAKYELYGVVCHNGGASYGHYTAFVKNPWTLKWYFCDDSNVVQQDPDQSIYSSAFILFWHREGIRLKSNLEFVRCRPKSPPPPLRTYSPAPSNSNSKPRRLGLSRRKQSVLPQPSSYSSASSHKPSPRKALFEKKNETTCSPTLRNEILAEFCDEETEESRTVDEDDVDCGNFIGRDDHLPYYSGMPNELNGQLNPNVTYTLDSDPLQVNPWG